MKDLAEEAQNKALALLNQVSGILREQDEQRKKTSSTDAPDFNLFKFIRGDELGLSAILANLLDPHGSHGQGATFLEAFLARLNQRPSWIAESEKCSVLLEHTTHQQRRIDVTLTFPRGIIGIENKPWAADQNQQLSHYIEFLSRPRNGSNRNWMLIYLCNYRPAEHSLPSGDQRRHQQSGNFLHITFREVVKWLEECMCICQSIKVRFFLADLNLFIRASINGENVMIDRAQVAKAIASEDNIAAALTILEATQDAKQQILAEFVDQLRAAVAAKGYHLKENLERWGERGTGFYIFRIEGDQLGAGFEFEKANLRDFVWGLSDSLSEGEPGQLPCADPLHQQAGAIMRRHFEGATALDSKGWPWYTVPQEFYLDPCFLNWETASAWLQIKNGAFLNRLMRLTDNVFEAFRGHEEVLAGSARGE